MIVSEVFQAPNGEAYTIYASSQKEIDKIKQERGLEEYKTRDQRIKEKFAVAEKAEELVKENEALKAELASKDIPLEVLEKVKKADVLLDENEALKAQLKELTKKK